MLNWLHFSDLHFGLSGQKPLWPNVKEALFNDLKRLVEKCGPWHLILFTGDLVQQGTEKEFNDLDKKVLATNGSAVLSIDLRHPQNRTCQEH